MYNSKHLATGSDEPKLNPDRLTIFNMRFCPYAERVVLVAIAKKIQFDVVNINLTDKPEWYFAKNPKGKVPAVQQGDFLVVESLDINEALDKRYPEPKLGPRNEEEKQRQDQLLEEITSKVLDVYSKMYRSHNKEELEKLFPVLEQGLQWLDGKLAEIGTPFLSGQERPGILDYNVWPWMPRLLIFAKAFLEKQILSPEMKHVAQWIERMKADPAASEYSVSDEIWPEYMRRARAADKTRYDILIEQGA